MDLAHRLTRRLAREAGLVAIEDLKTRSMTASARGTVEEPGRNVRQKAGLNRAILNVGWHAFERLLAYKMEESGGVLTKVRPHYTSQECAACGHVDKENRKSQAVFVCTACGASANADINAARTILARALSGEEPRRMNTTSLDVEAQASAACEASTLLAMSRLDAGIMAAGNPRPSGRGRC
jgi:putative transposase